MINIKIGDKVTHESVYNHKEILTVIGVRKDSLELEGDYSGGTNNTIQSSWLPLDKTLIYSTMNTEYIYETKIVSAFPGTGKSYYVNQDAYSGSFCCSDSDSSKFPKEGFPENYIEHIKYLIGKKRIVFVSSHKIVRDALVANNLEFTLVYPDSILKEEYLNRYKERGSLNSFIQLIDKNWDNWIDELKSQTGCVHIQLKSQQFLSNARI